MSYGEIGNVNFSALLQGVPSWAVMILIVALDMVFIAFEDKARHKADAIANAQPVDILRASDRRHCSR